MFKFVLRGLLLTALAAAPLPSSATLTVNNLIGFGAGGDAGPTVRTLEFIGCTFATTLDNPYTYSAHDVGDEAPSRLTVVGIVATDSASAFNVTGVTVGGDAATEIIDEAGSGAANSAIYTLENPSGAAEDIVVTHSEAITSSDICVWALYVLDSTTAVSSVADDDTSSGAVVLNHNTQEGGFSIALCQNQFGTPTTAWTGLTERLENAARGYAVADETAASTSTPLTANCDQDGTGDSSGVAAHWK